MGRLTGAVVIFLRGGVVVAVGLVAGLTAGFVAGLVEGRPVLPPIMPPPVTPPVSCCARATLTLVDINRTAHSPTKQGRDTIDIIFSCNSSGMAVNNRDEHYIHRLHGLFMESV